jgi:Ca2+-binding EF-hand superfamily protein
MRKLHASTVRPSFINPSRSFFMRHTPIATALIALALTGAAYAQSTAEPTIKPSAKPGEARQSGPEGGRGDWNKQLEERFKKADTNNDGFLTKDEAQKGGMERVANRFDTIDANKDGKVSMDEIRGAISKGREDMKDPKKREERMKEEFTRADTNKDGLLSEDEMTKANPRMALNFKAIDANNDGKVSQAELKSYMDKQMALRAKGGQK